MSRGNTDERIVKMQFDNKEFEKGVHTTISSLTNLKKSLKLEEGTEGLRKISEYASKHFSLGGIAGSIEAVSSKFTALGIAGITVLQDLTRKAIQSGEKIMSAFTIDPVKSGFREYETQINAVQTILANTSSQGTTLEQVNAALDELNRYADLTIYNFTEMTRNIGTFTAAGVDLDTSVSAIKGIANLAAVSGSTSQQASTAMYQLSQALAAGTVKLMDWNSVVNAGMGGQVFQDALKDTARVHGIAIDQMIKDEGSFRETLSKGWLSSSILTETLQKFTGDLTEAQLRNIGYTEDQITAIIKMGKTANDAATKVKTFTQLFDTLSEAAQSGWTQSWEYIIGDFEEAKTFLTGLSDLFSDMINKSADSRNSLLEGALTSKKVTDEDWNKLLKSGVAGEKFQEALKETARLHNVAIDDMVEKEGSFRATLKNGWLSLDILTETLDRYNGSVKISTTQISKNLEDLKKVAQEVISGKWANGDERKKKLAEAGHDYAAIQSMVNNLLLGTEINIENLSEAEQKAIGLTDEQAQELKKLAEEAKKTGTPINELIQKLEKPSGRELLLDSVNNTIQTAIKLAGTLQEAYRDIFPKMTSEQLYGILETVNKITDSVRRKVTKDAPDLKRTLKGLFAILDVGKTIIKDLATAGFEFLSKILGKTDINLLKFTGDIGDSLVGFRNWFKANDVFAKSLSTIADLAGTNVKKFVDWLKSIKEIPQVQKYLTKFQNGFVSLYKNGKNYWPALKSFVTDFIDALKKMDKVDLSNIKKVIESFKDKIENYFPGINKKLDSFAEVLSWFQSQYENAVEKLGAGADEAKKKISTFTDFLKEHINMWKIAGTALTVFFSVSLIKALKSITKLADTISEGIGSIKGITEGLNGVLAEWQKTLKATQFEKVARGIRTIAIAIAILGGTLVVLSYMDQDKLTNSALVLGSLVLTFTALGAVLALLNKKKFIGGDFTKSAQSLLMLSSSLFLIVLALQQVAKISESGGNVWEAVGVIGALTAGLAVIAGLLGKFVPKLSKGAFTLISFGLAINLLVLALKSLTQLDLSSLENQTETLVSILAGFGAIALMSSGATWGSAGTIIAMAVSLELIVDVINKITKINMDDVESHMSLFVDIIKGIAAIFVATKFAGKDAIKTGASLLLISVAMELIVLIIQQISKLEKMTSRQLGQVVTELSLVFLAMAVMLKSTKLAGDNAIKAGVGLLAMSAAMGVMAAIVTMLGTMSPTYLKQAVLTVAAIGAVFVGLIAVTKLAGSNVKSIVAITGSLGALLALTAVFALIPSEGLGKAVAAVSAIAAMLAILVASTKLATPSSISTVMVMSVIVALLGVVLQQLCLMPMDNALEVAASLSVLLLSLSASMVILSGMTPMYTLILANIGKIVLILGALSAVVAVLGWLYQQDGIENLLNGGIDFLGKLGEAIGAFVGGIAGGAIAKTSEAFPKVADNISKFMQNMQPFFEGLKGVDKNTVDAANSVAKIVLVLTAQTLVSSIVNFVRGKSSIPEFAGSLEDLGAGVKKFNDKVKGINSTAVKNGAEALSEIVKVADKIPNSGGLLGMLAGNNDINDFAKMLSEAAPNIVKYSTSISNVNVDAIHNSVSAMEELFKIADIIPNSGGLVAVFTGDNTMSKFGKGLVEFGNYLVEYMNAIQGANLAGIKISTNQIMALVDLANEINQTDTGNFANFGKALTSFGTNVVDNFASAFNVESTAKTRESGAMFITSLINSINNNAPRANNAMTVFIRNLMLIVSNLMNSYYKMYYSSGSNNMAGFVQGQNSRMAYAQQSIRWMIGNIISICNAYYNSYYSSGSNNMAGYVRGQNSRSNDTQNSIRWLMGNIVNTANSYSSSFYSVGQNMISGMVNGINSKASAAINAAASVAGGALNASKRVLMIKSPSREYMQVGKYSDEGFALGLLNNADVVEDASGSIAEKSLDSIRGVLSSISAYLLSDIDSQPTIRPVLDLTDIQNGAMRVNSILSGFSPEMMSGTIQITNRISRNIDRERNSFEEEHNVKKLVEAVLKLMDDKDDEPPTYNFYITGGDPQEIANEVSRILQKQKERKDASWG